MTLYARCSIASDTENAAPTEGLDMNQGGMSLELDQEGEQEVTTRTERVDFIFQPPKPQELRVGVEVYYKTNDRSPSFAKERYGNDADYMTPR